LVLAPHAGLGEVLAQADHRFTGPAVLDLGLVAVAGGVVGGGVVVQAVGHHFDDGAAFAAAGAFHGAAHALEHGDQVVAVHLQAVQAAGDALLGQGLGAGLGVAGHGDGPAVVDHAQHQRGLVGAGGVERGVEVGLRRAAVTAAGHGDAVLLAQLERQRGAGGHQALGGDGHAPGVVAPGALEIVAGFADPSVEVRFGLLDAAHELGAVFAVAGGEDVVFAHGGADAHVGGFVAEA